MTDPAIPCPECGGTGKIWLDYDAWIVSKTCGECDGYGGWNDDGD